MDCEDKAEQLAKRSADDNGTTIQGIRVAMHRLFVRYKCTFTHRSVHAAARCAIVLSAEVSYYSSGEQNQGTAALTKPELWAARLTWTRMDMDGL